MKKVVLLLVAIIGMVVTSCTHPQKPHSSERKNPDSLANGGIIGQKTGIVKEVTVFVTVQDGVTEDSIATVKPYMFINPTSKEIIDLMISKKIEPEDIVLFSAILKIDIGNGKTKDVPADYELQKRGDTVFVKTGKLVHSKLNNTQFKEPLKTI